MQSKAVYCILLQSTAVYYSLLQSTAVYCTWLHTTAVYFIILQCSAPYCSAPLPLTAGTPSRDIIIGIHEVLTQFILVKLESSLLHFDWSGDRTHLLFCYNERKSNEMSKSLYFNWKSLSFLVVSRSSSCLKNLTWRMLLAKRLFARQITR